MDVAPSKKSNPASRCPACRGTGFVVVEDRATGRSTARRCECRLTGRGEELLRQARIPKRYAGCDFGSFFVLNQSLEAALRRTRAFVAEYTVRKVGDEGQFGLLLLGAPGVGKTHLAVAALRELILEHGVQGLFSDFRDLLNTLRSSYDAVSETTEMEVLRPLLQAEVLVLDDLGVCKMSEWVRDTVGLILNSRYNERRITLITTNLSDDPAGRTPDRASIADRIGPALRSRLNEMCFVLSLQGEDYRYKVAQHSEKAPLRR